MGIEIWFTFVIAVITFCAIPGPTALLVIAQAMKNGKGSGIPMSIGVILGCLTSMTLSFVGLGAILMTSSTLFLLFKWLGVGYLVYLGIKTFFEKTSDIEIDKNPVKLPNKKLLVSTYCVTTLNPKGVIFFVAFFPQFIEIDVSFYTQMLILVPTFVVILGSSILLYSLFSEKVGDKIKSVQARKNESYWWRSTDRCGSDYRYDREVNIIITSCCIEKLLVLARIFPLSKAFRL